MSYAASGEHLDLAALGSRGGRLYLADRLEKRTEQTLGLLIHGH